MWNLIVNILFGGIAFIAGAYFLKGVSIKGISQAFIVAVVVALLNATLGRMLSFMTLGLLSWGIFSWVLGALIIMVADYFLPKFKVENFWWAFGLSAVVSVVSSFLHWIF